MKIHVVKKAIPIIVAGTVLVCGTSRIAKIKNNKNDISNNSVTIANDDNTTVENVINNIEESLNTEIIKDATKEKKQIEQPKMEKINGVNIETKKVVVPTTTVNIRKDSSTNSDIIGTITENSALDLIYEEDKDWYKVKYNDEEGYISRMYSSIQEQKNIKDKMKKIIYFNNDSQMYDSSECTNSIMNIPALEAAKVYGETDNNYLISLNGKIGYVNKKNTEVLDGTFVIVDISDQIAYLYEDNELIISTNVVTGKLSTPTTKGLHKVWDISSNRYLKGPGYKSYVDYMMAFHNGEGLHDAEYHTHYNSNGSVAFSHGWRGSSSFGGQIYKSNGSHGCVNMPHDAAKTMYEHIKLGDKVLVKE